MTMTFAATTLRFLNATDAATRTETLALVAAHYQITPEEALEEVTGPEAEHLLDYLTERG